MFDPARYRYFLKPQKMSQLKIQFYRQICTRNGNQQHLTKAQLIHFLIKEGIDIKISNLPYFDRQLFKQENKQQYSCRETITIVDRLSINCDVEKEYERVFRKFDANCNGVITAFQLKKVINRCNLFGMRAGSGCNSKGKNLDDAQIQEIFNELDVDQDGLISFEDFLCAMISK